MFADFVTRHLACPKCHSAITHRDAALACTSPSCAWQGTFTDRIAVVAEGAKKSYFDDKVEVMQAGHEDHSTEVVFQAAQMRLFTEAIPAGAVVLDVGCGPAMPYERPKDCTVIGVDMSLESLRANHALDLRVYASAAELPLRDRSVNTVVCAYSVHHFVGTTVADNERLVEAAFREFGRVLVPGGELFVFDVAPRQPFGIAQRTFWNGAKRLLGPKLDMFFWRADALEEMGARCLPHAGALELRRFDAPWWSTIAPVFALPKLRIPRGLYPFDVCMYRWRLGPPDARSAT